VLESAEHINYTPRERLAVEQMIVTRASRAMFVEAWGDFYVARTSASTKSTAAAAAMPFPAIS
jgi:hypothetical protein